MRIMSKKIIFYLDNDLRQFCLSYYLQQKIDSEFFSIIDITDKPKKFFKEQKFVNFQKKWFLHDYTIPTNEIDFEYLKKFEEKESLNFTLLSDEDHAVAEKYGVWGLKKFMGREFMGIIRTTFIIDRQGKLVHIMDKVKTKSHHDDVLEILKTLD